MGAWISRVADAVLAEVRERQGRALERMYPIMIFNALGSLSQFRSAGLRKETAFG